MADGALVVLILIGNGPHWARIILGSFVVIVIKFVARGDRVLAVGRCGAISVTTLDEAFAIQIPVRVARPTWLIRVGCLRDLVLDAIFRYAVLSFCQSFVVGYECLSLYVGLCYTEWANNRISYPVIVS